MSAFFAHEGMVAELLSHGVLGLHSSHCACDYRGGLEQLPLRSSAFKDYISLGVGGHDQGSDGKAQRGAHGVLSGQVSLRLPLKR